VGLKSLKSPNLTNGYPNKNKKNNNKNKNNNNNKVKSKPSRVKIHGLPSTLLQLFYFSGSATLRTLVTRVVLIASRDGFFIPLKPNSQD
jgi:hypothetical protein